MSEHMGKPPRTHTAPGSHILQRKITVQVVADPKLDLLHLLLVLIRYIGVIRGYAAGEDHQQLKQIGSTAMLIKPLLDGISGQHPMKDCFKVRIYAHSMNIQMLDAQLNEQILTVCAGEMDKIGDGIAVFTIVVFLIFQWAEENDTARWGNSPGAVLFYMAFPGGNIQNVVIGPALWTQGSPADFLDAVNAAGVDKQRIIGSNMFTAVDKASPSLMAAL